MNTALTRGNSDRFQQQDEGYNPPVLSVSITLVAAVVSVGAIANVSLELAGAGALTTVILALGLARGSSRFLIAAIVVLFSCVLIAGIIGMPVAIGLVAVAGTLIAYDSAIYAVRLGRQTTKATTTWRAEALHHSVTTLVIGGAAVAGTALFLTGPGNLPVGALFVLVLSAGLLLWVVQSQE